jgi:hypothetical protein
MRVSGPALCALPEATLLVPPGWVGQVDEQGTITLVSARENVPPQNHPAGKRVTE